MHELSRAVWCNISHALRAHSSCGQTSNRLLVSFLCACTTVGIIGVEVLQVMLQDFVISLRDHQNVRLFRLTALDCFKLSVHVYLLKSAHSVQIVLP